LLHLRLRFQFPECVVSGGVADSPPGVSVRLQPEIPEMAVIMEGSGRAVYAGPKRPTNIFVLEADRLIPHRQLRILLRSRCDLADELTRSTAERLGGDRSLALYAEGRFVYSHAGEQFERKFLVPLSQTNGRIVTAGPAEEDLGERKFISGIALG
jgi:hypothetical protein